MLTKIFITPSGIETLKMNHDDIVEVDLKGRVLNNKKPSSEILMHLDLYKSKPKINSIVHCHSMWSSILSCQRKKIPAFHYMVAQNSGGNDIKCANYATFGSSQLAKNVVTAMKEREGCLLANHGQLAIGKNLQIAFNLAIALRRFVSSFLL